MSTTSEHRTPEADPSRTALADLSNAMVALYKEHLGRGPMRVRTSYAGPDCVVCILEDTMTPAERTLADLGELRELRELRSIYQHSFEDQFTGAVERILGRRVRSFLSSFDAKTGAAGEVFLLEPEFPEADPGA